jgi:hypothetical protein
MKFVSETARACSKTVRVSRQVAIWRQLSANNAPQPSTPATPAAIRAHFTFFVQPSMPKTRMHRRPMQGR